MRIALICNYKLQSYKPKGKLIVQLPLFIDTFHTVYYLDNKLKKMMYLS